MYALEHSKPGRRQIIGVPFYDILFIQSYRIKFEYYPQSKEFEMHSLNAENNYNDPNNTIACLLNLAFKTKPINWT